MSSGALAARYSAVSAPVNPVAPNTTISCSRSAMFLGYLARELQSLLQIDAGVRGQPRRGGGRNPFGRMRGLGREAEDEPEVLLRRRLQAELLRVCLEPVCCVHRPRSHELRLYLSQLG